jgi:hypothetical protein
MGAKMVIADLRQITSVEMESRLTFESQGLPGIPTNAREAGRRILSFAINGLRRRDHDFLHRHAPLADHFEQERGADHVRMEKLPLLRHRVLVARLMKDHIDTRDRARDRGAIAHIALDQFDAGIDTGGHPCGSTRGSRLSRIRTS